MATFIGVRWSDQHCALRNSVTVVLRIVRDLGSPHNEIGDHYVDHEIGRIIVP